MTGTVIPRPCARIEPGISIGANHLEIADWSEAGPSGMTAEGERMTAFAARSALLTTA
jgi:hypothetical protein